MHQLNVLVFGPNNFLATLNELKSYLKFKFSKYSKNFNKNLINQFDVVILHKESLESKQNIDIINTFNTIKILASDKIDNNIYDSVLQLPTTINEINSIVESSVAKKVFNSNSSIKIKKYLLDKNEKTLIKNNISITLTEKEIELLELFLNEKKPISKKKILSLVWNYSSNADTHTVETHIYRLRKKINKNFFDDNFILNNKNGYYF
jgi:hypothetical protein